jgi:hypothetical protein
MIEFGFSVEGTVLRILKIRETGFTSRAPLFGKLYLLNGKYKMLKSVGEL